jgi:hypothetical protein
VFLSLSHKHSIKNQLPCLDSTVPVVTKIATGQYKSFMRICNVNRIWKGTATENFHIKFHTKPNNSPQNIGQFQESLLEKGYPKLHNCPKKMCYNSHGYHYNAAADVLAVHRQAHCHVIAATHEYGQICTVRFIYSEQTTNGKSRTT